MTSSILAFLIPSFSTHPSTYVTMYVQEDIVMLNANIINFRRNIFELLEQTIRYNESVNISTKAGNVVPISEEDYNSLMKILYLSSLPKERTKIIEGLHTSLEDYLSEDEAT